MLPSIKSALHVKGRKTVVIARELERTPNTLHQWWCGRLYIGQRVRAAIDTAIGAPVNWQEYEAEFADTKAARQTQHPAPAHDPEPAPPAPPPETPAKAPNPPAQAPRRLTATPPTQKPQSRPKAVPSAPAAMPPARKGFFASLLKDDGDLFQ